MSTVIEFDRHVDVFKVDKKLGLVFGYAIVTKVNGKPYFDVQGDHITDDAMLEASLDFMKNGAVADDMHEEGTDHGVVPFVFPMTEQIAKALEIEVKQHGLLIAMRPGPAELAKFESGARRGFSIGGSYGRTTFV